MVAELETFKGLVQAIHSLMQGTSAMSKHQNLAHPSGIAIEIAQAKKIPADEFFKTLASVPRDKV